MSCHANRWPWSPGARSGAARALLFSVLLLAAPACYSLRPTSGGADASFDGPRRVRTADIAVPAGYRIEAVAQGLTFPSAIAFDGNCAIITEISSTMVHRRQRCSYDSTSKRLVVVL